jgi:hypothetical protein
MRKNGVLGGDCIDNSDLFCIGLVEDVKKTTYCKDESIGNGQKKTLGCSLCRARRFTPDFDRFSYSATFSQYTAA